MIKENASEYLKTYKCWFPSNVGVIGEKFRPEECAAKFEESTFCC